MASQFVFDAIGTHWVIDVDDPLTKQAEQRLLSKITERIDAFDLAYSRFRDDSLVTAISKKPGRYALPSDAPPLFDVYRKLYDLTEGLVTPLIGQVLVDAGYDAKYSLKQSRSLMSPLSWDEVMSYADPYLDVKVPVLLDFGAAGKGYLIDIVSDILKQNQIASFCVDAGGDILQRNETNTALPVGLEHPEDTTKVVGIVKILNQSLCGSAGNRRVWDGFHHIINPKSLTSPSHILAVWTVAKNTIIADALTTALFFIDRETLLPHFDFESFILYSDYSFQKSAGFNAEIFTI